MKVQWLPSKKRTSVHLELLLLDSMSPAPSHLSPGTAAHFGYQGCQHGHPNGASMYLFLSVFLESHTVRTDLYWLLFTDITHCLCSPAPSQSNGRQSARIILSFFLSCIMNLICSCADLLLTLHRCCSLTLPPPQSKGRNMVCVILSIHS